MVILAMNILDALTEYIKILHRPILTYYDLGLCFARLYKEKKFREEVITDIPRKYPTIKYLKRIKESLEHRGVIKQQDNTCLVLSDREYSPLDILCSSDPFLYVSHLSAMSIHGLADNSQTTIFVSSPAPRKWRQLAKEKMEIDYEGQYHEYLESTLPRLSKVIIKKIENCPVNYYSSINLGAFDCVEGSSIRVSTLGRTFLDMIRDPVRCGGMLQVVHSYKCFGAKFKDQIIDEVEKYGNKIEKVRAGYLLEEVCNVKNKRINKWLGCVERGGSRKLDPTVKYSPVYSEKWCLSINIDLELI